jgi:4-carboxymuconolactone decarboxylase
MLTNILHITTLRRVPLPFLPDPDIAADPALAETFARVERSRGWVSNAMRAFAHAPEGLGVFSAVGHYGRYGTALTEVQRELVILIVGRSVPYAWTHHVPLGLQAGITQAQIDAIAAGDVPAGLPPADSTLCAYVLAFLAGRGTPPALAEALAASFTPRQVTDITLLAAYYLALGTSILALGVEVEPPEILAIELEWQRKQASGKD